VNEKVHQISRFIYPDRSSFGLSQWYRIRRCGNPIEPSEEQDHLIYRTTSSRATNADNIDPINEI